MAWTFFCCFVFIIFLMSGLTATFVFAVYVSTSTGITFTLNSMMPKCKTLYSLPSLHTPFLFFPSSLAGPALWHLGRQWTMTGWLFGLPEHDKLSKTCQQCYWQGTSSCRTHKLAPSRLDSAASPVEVRGSNSYTLLPDKKKKTSQTNQDLLLTDWSFKYTSITLYSELLVELKLHQQCQASFGESKLYTWTETRNSGGNTNRI